MYENVITRILESTGNELFYYTFKKEILKDEEENKTVRGYETDFLLSRKDNICLIETESFGYNSRNSLDKFQQKILARILIQRTGIFHVPRFKKRQGYFLSAVYMIELF